MKEKVLLVFGGKSVEHDISIITALQVAKNLPSQFDFMLVYIDKKGQWWTAENLEDLSIYENFSRLAKKPLRITFLLGEDILFVLRKNKMTSKVKVKAVLNCCHGHFGEDGCLQGLLETCEIPQTSTSVLASAVCMDKAVMKDVCKAHQILTPDFLVFTETDLSQKTLSDLARKCQQKLGFPLVVKPASLGSSIGISVCKNADELEEAIQVAFSYDQKVVVEKMIQPLREFNCACLFYEGKHHLSSVNEVSQKGEIFSFEDKYLSEASHTEQAEKSLSNRIKNLTQKLCKIFSLTGVVRVDFLFDEQQNLLYVNEINTIPGSLAFYLFKDLPFKELISALIEQSLKIQKQKNSKILSFESSALKTFKNASEILKK